MPYFCTHLAFGDRVAKALGSSIETLGEPYVLGCFGPDLYFFDRLPPTPFIPHVKKHGNALHNLDASVLFKALCTAANQELHPYLFGFLTHIALDSTLHPYVEARHTGIDHTRFEGVIDSIVCEDTKDRISYETILKHRTDVKAIDALLADASEALHLREVRGAYTRSYRKFRRLVPFLYDPTGRRYRALLKTERLFHKDGLISAFLLAAPRADTEDCMNRSHAPWSAPWKPEQQRNESVPELLDEAEALAVRWIRLLQAGETESLFAALRNRTMQKGVL